MTHRVGPKGQVVIPKNLREALGLVPGDEVDFSLDGYTVRVERVGAPDRLMGSCAGLDLVGALEAERAREQARGR